MCWYRLGLPSTTNDKDLVSSGSNNPVEPMDPVIQLTHLIRLILGQRFGSNRLDYVGENVFDRERLIFADFMGGGFAF